MPPAARPRVIWVVLTMGDRPIELQRSIDSIRAVDPSAAVLLVVNGGAPMSLDGVHVLHLPDNVGVPGGRHHAVESSDADIYIFLDDDATVVDLEVDRLLDAFVADPRLAVASFRIVDEQGTTERKHIPRVRSNGVETRGTVATFLGGACAIRASAYHDARGYRSMLHYSHEELDLAWRMIDAGWSIEYWPSVVIFHPRTEISQRPQGWGLTGRNRVVVARADLPWPVAVVHTVFWLIVGSVRTPTRETGRAYRSGWFSGWKVPVDRRPISWRSVWRLTRLGRPPIV